MGRETQSSHRGCTVIFVSRCQDIQNCQTYVVPVAARCHVKLYSERPPTGVSGVGGHLVALSIVVPRACNVAALDVSGGAEGEGGSGGGGRHNDDFEGKKVRGILLSGRKINYWIFKKPD